jgi:3-phenylpropionate/trans-cinnamate dioxygenase ferredoxin reductase component
MANARYLIVGGGMTADAAVRGIRELDSDGSITILSAEPDAPYARPPLTKALWKGEPLESIWKHTDEQGANLVLATRAARLDVAQKKVTDERGVEHGYDRLLLATGGAPRHLPGDNDGVIYFRTVQDYRRVRELADDRKRFVVIGGGFIGSEIAAALAMNGCEVTMLFPEPGIGARIFPADLARSINGYYGEKGVTVRSGESVRRVARSGSQFIVETENGPVTADAVIAGLGIIPATDLASAAGLKVDDGIVVDEQLRTSKHDIFAAGDVARATVPALGSMRVEHEDNALTMGHAAGRAMAGDDSPYRHIPFFYSDLFELGYEAVGQTDSRLETVADWKEKFREGVVYYLGDGRVKGVLLWGVFGRVDEARELITDARPVQREELAGRILLA